MIKIKGEICINTKFFRGKDDSFIGCWSNKLDQINLIKRTLDKKWRTINLKELIFIIYQYNH